MLNKDGSITICGINLDFPTSKNTRGFDCTEHKDGKSIIREMWLNSYHNDNNSYVCWSYKISITNRGKCEFEGKSVKNEDISKIKYVFDNFKKND